MTLTTTPSIEGKRAVKYLGLVSGDAILGANIFRDFFASIRDIVGGRSASYEAELRKAKDIALGECANRPGIWEPTPSSASISTTKRSGRTAACGRHWRRGTP